MKAIKFLSVLLLAAFLAVPMANAAETSVNNNNSITVASSNDCDDLLNELDKLVDDYIVIMKDINNGNMSAMDKYQKLTEDLTEVEEKLEAVGDDFTPSQLNRYMEIMEKLSNSLQ